MDVNLKDSNAIEMSSPETAINVVSFYTSRRLWSRYSILNWINQILKSNICKVDDLCSGAAFCCLMDILFPDSINMRKVKFTTNKKNDYINNFLILQQGFKKHNVDKEIPINELIKGKFQDNYDFVIWFRLFFNANFRRMPHGYDVSKRRFNQVFLIGSPHAIKRSRTSVTIKYPVCPGQRSVSQEPNVLESKYI